MIASGATKDIGTALTRVCLRHRAIETRMKTFISVLMDTLITPLSERADEWRRGGCATGALSREHARECKRARAELRRRVHDAQRNARKARRAQPHAKHRAEVGMQCKRARAELRRRVHDAQRNARKARRAQPHAKHRAEDVEERKQQLEEMEEKAVKAALVEERSRFCHFVSLLNPVVESEVAMLAEVGPLQEGSQQLVRHTGEPRTLPPASLQVICDIKSYNGGWDAGSAPHSPSPSSRLGSRKSSLTSISSLNTQHNHDASSSTVSCSTPISSASSTGTLPPAHDAPHCLSQGSDNQSVSSECTTPAKSTIEDHDDNRDGLGNAASATWPDLKDTAQFERAATAIMAGRPHTISAAYERGHPRPALSVHTFASEQEMANTSARDNGIYARPPLPTIPNKSGPAAPDGKMVKPSSLPPHLTKEMPQALYVNMSELATLAASRAQQHHNANAEHPPQEKVT
ncbi:hypothetical protein JYU34_020537 [Plutella xylostella]|uniref:IMD domain-containing protein n=1 Tax=Plutella xylostella TaxID=51655 RepID=A0ABQ7PUU6_PLUXY|nr:hypothetical protein JYU34_020537 [Plutella xylostella]